jgi:ankyrin repeat protein
MNNLINYFKFGLLAIVLYGFSFCHAGSYEDYFKAIKQDDALTVQRLIQRGFDPNTLDPEARHGLIMAIADASLKVAQVLIEAKGTNVNFLNQAGESALMYAALKGHLALVKLLISKDADINKSGWTPLHYACTNGHLEIAQFLLEKGAVVDALSPNETTPLMMAIRAGNIQLVRLLLDRGADIRIRNQQGFSAIDVAELFNQEEIHKGLRARWQKLYNAPYTGGPKS